MRKKFLYPLLCMFVLCAWFDSLHARNGEQKTGDSGSYIIWEPLLSAPSQITVNSNLRRDGGNVGNLIDGDVNTLVHSMWNVAMKNPNITEEEWLEAIKKDDESNVDAGYHNVQVAIGHAVSVFKFQYKGRNDKEWHDNPNHIAIYATNDDDLGSRTTNKDQDKWTFITELTPENGNFPGDVPVVDVPYESPVIEMSEPFKYIRFVVLGTTHMGKHSERTFKNPDVTGITWNMSEIQVFEAVKTENYASILPNVVDSISGIITKYDFVYGDAPGYTDSVKHKAFKQVYDEVCSLAYENYDNATLKGYCKNLRDAFAELMTNGIHQVETGYYYIMSAYEGYVKNQNVTKSMCVDIDNKLVWNTTDLDEPTHLWYIGKLAGGNYSIRNVATNGYIGTGDGHPQMTATQEVEQVIGWFTDAAGQFHIENVLNSNRYHTEGHMKGGGMQGLVCTWNEGSKSPSAWRFMKLTDQAKIDEMVAKGPSAIFVNRLADAVAKAETKKEKAFEYRKLITAPAQVSTNSQSTRDGSAIRHLIDGNANTIFHSVWEDNFANPQELGTSYGWHNLQIKFNEPVSTMKFSYMGRNDDDGWHDSPDHITIYGTNDDALGASTAAADSARWTEIVDMTGKNYDFPKNVSGSRFNSPDIDLGGSYKYLRFVVKHTTTMNPGGNRANSYANPAATGVTFNLGEFQIFETELDPKSEYHTVAGMKEACDLLETAILSSKDKIRSGNVTQADIDALEAAVLGFDTVYVDRPAVHGQLKSLLDQAQLSYNAAIGERIKLITEASQMKANSYEKRKNPVNVGMLIDGNKYTCFHTMWDAAMKERTNLTVTEWEGILVGHNNGSVGAGYHNLQVELAVPQSKFFFEYYGRQDDVWHDNPNDIAIYATNDAELASDIRDAATPQWTFITELTEGFPENVRVEEIPYTSPMIDLGGEYKFVRFVVKNTTNAGSMADRTFNNPEITGVTWSMGEFQMFAGLDPESIQYNYIPEVREAADGLKAIIEKYAALTPSDIVSDTPVVEIQAALNKLLTAYVDTADVVKLHEKYKALVPVTEEGEGVGYIDDYAQVDAFAASLDEARKLVSPKQPTKKQVKEAMDSMDAAYATFLSHIATPVPYVWYNIKSTSTREYFSEQPIHLQKTSLGDQLHVKDYPIGNELTDIYAIWRIVPVDTLPGTYAIQSLGTGQYFGPYRGMEASNSPLMSYEKTPYVIEYCGRTSFKIRQASVTDEKNSLKTDVYEGVVENWPSNGDHQQEFKFVDVAAETDMVNINWYPAKNTGIITLPWACKGDNALSINNMDIETYGVNSIVSAAGAEGEAGETTLTLTAKDEFEAGEPIVLVTTAEPDANGQQPLTFMLPAAEAGAVTDTSAVAANGLKGTLQGMNISTATNLYFSNSALTICGDDPVWIAGRGGWIDASQVTDLQGSIDKTITISGMVNSIGKVVVEDPDALVNVYTIDGVLVKQNVKAADATKKLAKGIYIVGKKKVLVR